MCGACVLRAACFCSHVCINWCLVAVCIVALCVSCENVCTYVCMHVLCMYDTYVIVRVSTMRFFVCLFVCLFLSPWPLHGVEPYDTYPSGVFWFCSGIIPGTC